MQVLGILAFFVLGIAQVIAGWVGADYYVGGFWASVILVACLMTRFMFPLTIFGFLGAIYVWEWPWWGAALLTFPGLLIAIPSLLVMALGALGLGRSVKR
jgi:hypothetical protein